MAGLQGVMSVHLILLTYPWRLQVEPSTPAAAWQTTTCEGTQERMRQRVFGATQKMADMERSGARGREHFSIVGPISRHIFEIRSKMNRNMSIRALPRPSLGEKHFHGTSHALVPCHLRVVLGGGLLSPSCSALLAENSGPNGR